MIDPLFFLWPGLVAIAVGCVILINRDLLKVGAPLQEKEALDGTSPSFR